MKILKDMCFSRIWHKIYIDPRSRRMIRQWGIPIILKIDEAAKRTGVPYSLVFGSLLGAVREKGFIAHDCDLDIALWADEDYTAFFDILKNSGFTKYRQILVDEGKTGREETWKFHSVHVDLFFFYPTGENTYYGTEFFTQTGCRNWKESIEKYGGLKVLKSFLPISKDTEYVPFESINAAVTKDALAFVEEYYGQGWRIPDPTFVYPRKGENRYEELQDKVGIIRNFK